jgi:hypothetical protein
MPRNLIILLFCVLCYTAIQAANPQLVQNFNLHKSFSFEENKGQLADEKGELLPDILYYGKDKGVNVYCFKNKIAFVFTKATAATHPPEGGAITDSPFGGLGGKSTAHSPFRGLGGDSTTITAIRMDMVFLNARTDTRVIAEQQEESYNNYYLAQCPNGVTTHSYKKLTYKNIYPNVDLILSAKGVGMEYSFVVYPGGDVRDIKIQWNGADSIRQMDGGIRYANGLGYLREGGLNASLSSGKKLNSNYKIEETNVSFIIGKYDKAAVLTIDPGLDWSTYFGDSAEDQSYCLARDGAGYLYFAGSTYSTAGIASTGAYQITNASSSNNQPDAYVAKFSSAGERIWSTYFGGSDLDIASAVSVDTSDNVIITGVTASTSGIASPGAYQTKNKGGSTAGPGDAFIAKFSNAGKRVWSTYYGGTDEDWGRGIATDKKNSILITGLTRSTSFIATSRAYSTSYNGLIDAFLAKFDSSGSLVWGTYFGGTSQDVANAIATDTADNIYITGYAYSSGMSSTGAYQTSLSGLSDAFLTKFSTSGVLKWSTYLGGSNYDVAEAMATDKSGNIYITGYTTSTSGIASSGGFQTKFTGSSYNGLIEKFTSSGKRAWGTYYGDASTIGYALDCDTAGNLFITGYTSSKTGIATAGAYQTSISALGECAFAAEFSSAGGRAWGTYFHGDVGEEGRGIVVDDSDNVFITGTTGSTNLATPHAFKTSNGNTDAFLARFTPVINDAGISKIISPQKPFCTDSASVIIRLKNFGNIELDSVKIYWAIGTKWQPFYNWKGKLAPDSVTNVTIGEYYFPAGYDSVKSWTYFPNSQEDAFPKNDTAFIIDTIYGLPSAYTGGNKTICKGDTIRLGTVFITGHSYTWTSRPTGIISATSDPLVKPDTTSTYYLSETITATGCTKTDSSVITVYPKPSAQLIPDKSICAGDSILLRTATATPGNTYSWTSKPTGFTSTVNNPVVSPLTTTKYYLTETIKATGCSKTDSVTVNVISFSASAGKSHSTCYGSGTTIGAAPIAGHKYQWTSKPAGFTSTQSNPAVSPKANTVYYLTETDSLYGCSHSDSVLITINSLPAPDAGRDTTVCGGSSVLLGANLSGKYNYSWKSMPGGYISSNRTVAVDPTDSTYYIVTATDSNGCSNTDTVQIKANPAPNAFVGDNKGVCPGDSIQLGANAVAGHTYSWVSNPKGFTSNISNPIVRPFVITTYYLTETSAHGCSKSDSVTITVNPLPLAQTSGNKTICQGDKIAIGASAVSGNSHQWTSYPIGFASNNSNPEVSPEITTTYYLTETNASGCSKSDSLTITVNPVPQKPSAGKDQKVCSGDTVTLSFSPAAGMKYTWTSISGFTSTDSAIQVHPSVTTDYILTASNKGTGCSNADTVRVTVIPLPQPKIVGQKSFCGTDTATYTTPGHDSSAYIWTISNGKILSGQSSPKVKVKWYDTGSVSLSVAETNTNGCQKTDSIHIEVHPKPNAGFIPYVSCAGNPVRFADSLKKGFSYTWDFGDGTVLKDQLPIHAYAKAGKYRMKETVQNAAGCQDTLSYLITMYPVPDDVKLLVQHDTGRTYQFGVSDTTYMSYTWSFGDGDSSMEKSPVHTFTKSLPDKVKLIVDNSFHCIAEIDTTLEVSYLTDKDSINIFPNPFSNQIHIYERLKENTNLKLYIYDMLGQKILENASWSREPGEYTESFDEYGLAQAMYIIKLVINDKEIIYKKMLKLGR